jgi:hypothetical protein
MNSKRVMFVGTDSYRAGSESASVDGDILGQGQVVTYGPDSSTWTSGCAV